MIEDVEVLTLSQAGQWREAHRDGGLPSQSWEYARALNASGIEPKLAVVRARGARMLLPFHERDWLGNIDIATLVAACGASITPLSTAPLRLWHEFAASNGWVAGYIQLSTSTELRKDDIPGNLVDLNEWFVLDVASDTPPRPFATLIRRKINRAVRDQAVLVEQRQLLARECNRMYPGTMRRVGAGPMYNFAEETIDRWVNDPAALVLGAELAGRVESVSVFLVYGDQAEYLLNASSERGRSLTAWLISSAISRLGDMGVRQLHLGGGVRRNDGLHEFKRKFRGTPKALQAIRQVYDRDRFDFLCAQAGVHPGNSQFHPAYRTAAPPNDRASLDAAP